jgi:hypothetical protein
MIDTAKTDRTKKLVPHNGNTAASASAEEFDLRLRANGDNASLRMTQCDYLLDLFERMADDDDEWTASRKCRELLDLARALQHGDLNSWFLRSDHDGGASCWACRTRLERAHGTPLPSSIDPKLLARLDLEGGVTTCEEWQKLRVKGRRPSGVTAAALRQFDAAVQAELKRAQSQFDLVVRAQMRRAEQMRHSD